MPTSNSDVPSSVRIAQLREKFYRDSLLSELGQAGIVVHAGTITFLDIDAVEKAQAHAVQTGLVPGWKTQTSWSKVTPSLMEWLTNQDEVVCATKRIVAPAAWFADNLDALHSLWVNLYFLLLDGSHGYYVHIDSERGIETNIW
jgi:hypothetical protein